MTVATPAPAWPEPYLQPDPTQDCGYYAAAYLARCLGHPDVTAGQVKTWREQTRIHEAMYAANVLGAKMRRFWDYYNDRGSHQIFWLGQGKYPAPERCAASTWVRMWLADGWIAQAMVHRVQPMGHAVVLLGASDDGVLLMDPIYGHVTEPWSWFLGPGPKADAEDWPGRAADGREFHGCTFIEGWYRTAVSP